MNYFKGMESSAGGFLKSITDGFRLRLNRPLWVLDVHKLAWGLVAVVAISLVMIALTRPDLIVILPGTKI